MNTQKLRQKVPLQVQTDIALLFRRNPRTIRRWVQQEGMELKSGTNQLTNSVKWFVENKLTPELVQLIIDIYGNNANTEQS